MPMETDTIIPFYIYIFLLNTISATWASSPAHAGQCLCADRSGGASPQPRPPSRSLPSRSFSRLLLKNFLFLTAQLSQLCRQMLWAPRTSPGLLLSPPDPSPVLPPNPPASPQSTLASAQSIGSSLPVPAQSLSETHLETSPFRKAS